MMHFDEREWYSDGTGKTLDPVHSSFTDQKKNGIARNYA